MVVKLSDFLSTSFSTFSANDTNNTGVTYPGAVVHTTTLTPGVGIGAGIDFQVETADNNTETGMRLEAVTTDVTAGSEDFDLVVKLMQNGAAANEKFRVTSTGTISTTTLNAASHTVGTFFTANSTLVNAAAINITGQVNTATLYATTSANIASAVQANATGVWTTGTVNAASHTVGTAFTANSTLVNAAAINITGQVNTATFFATTSANVGANVQANTTSFFVGNSTFYSSIDNGGIYINELGVNYGTLGPDQLYFSLSAGGYGQYTPSSLTFVGAGAAPNSVSLNSTLLQIGNSSVTSNLFSSSLAISNFFNANSLGVYHTGTVNAASHTIGTTLIANTLGVYHTGTMNAASHTVGTSTIANSIGVYTGIVNAASHTVGTSFTANSTVVNAVAYYAGTLLVGNTTVVNATHLSGTAGSGYQTTAGLSANVATLTSNNATNLGGVAAAAYLSNTANKTISGGFNVTANPLTASTSFTVNPLLGNYQYITNNGAFTITAPGSDCAVDLLIINGATPGAITFTSFQVGATGGSMTPPTANYEYIVSIRRIAGYSTYSIYAMQ